MVLREDIFRRCGPLSYCSGGVVCFECGKIAAKTFRALHYTKHKKQTTVNQTLIVLLKGFLG